MAQKINPISFRLGTTKVWKSSLQSYGKSFNVYHFLLKKCMQTKNTLSRLFYKYEFLLEYEELKFYPNKIFMNIYYLRKPYSNKLVTSMFFNKIFTIINRCFILKVYTRLYWKSELKASTSLIIAYVRYLYLKETSSKKNLGKLYKILESQLNSEKILFLKTGILKVSLKGFKIRLAGRLEGSKNQMAKHIEYGLGSLSLTSLKSYVEHKNEEIYTKFGVCGFQIWLFYEIK